MTASSKISTRVDCATTIVGERVRCPACHQRHAASSASWGDEDMTVPRPRHDTALGFLVRWTVVIELLVIGVLGLIVVARGCSS